MQSNPDPPCQTRRTADKTGYGNEFVPYVVMTEAMLGKIFNDCNDSMEVYEQVKKMTTNYRVWNIVTDFLTQADYPITDKVAEIKNSERS